MITKTKRKEEKNKNKQTNAFIPLIVMQDSAAHGGNDEVSYSVLPLLAGCGMCLLLSFTAG